jgi:structure-specific endonuclease subunit SLX1
VHLLIRVPSFARWPLKLHFFSRDVYSAWQGWCKGVDEPLRDTLPVVTDFEPSSKGTSPVSEAESGEQDEPSEPWGIHSLPLDYAPLKKYSEKARSIFSFEREGDCVVCKEEMLAGRGLYAVCSNGDCEGVGHVDCWSRHMLDEEEDRGAILPVRGHCPKCGGEVLWGDMMKEISLRIRGQKEVDKLLKKKRGAKAKA